MLPGDVQAKVYALLDDYIGRRKEELSLESRLSFDLGMEGIDAEEFFERYEKEFSVDISDLRSDWNAYFSEESFPPVPYVVLLFVAIGLKFGFERLFPVWPGWISWVLAFGLPVGGLALWARLAKHPRDKEITIRQLLVAVESGRLKLTLPS